MTKSRLVLGRSWLSNAASRTPDWNLFLAERRFKMTGFRVLLRRRT